MIKVLSIAIVGIEGRLVEVEVDIKPGLSSFNIVGLAGKAIQESRNRVAAAIRNSGFDMPTQRITVNLAPAGLIKNETYYDLPIAVCILLSSGQIKADVTQSVFWGELSLDGLTRESNGALVVADSSKHLNIKDLFIPKINAIEAGIIAGINIRPVEKLSDVFQHFHDNEILKFKYNSKKNSILQNQNNDFKYLKGQATAKRILEIAAAGGHNVLFSGTPGAGKTFIARAANTILPSMSMEERIEVTKIHSIAGLLNPNHLITERPFRNPHHTISHIALVGGGTIPRPGEITLAHRGILFLDEFNEFGPRTLEVLRQPLEDRIVNITRVSGVMTFPANFMLIAAMNPCKCGYYGDDLKECICRPYDLEKYQKKISGPILDRFDLQLLVPRVTKEEMLDHQEKESSAVIRGRVEQARAFQKQRMIELGIDGPNCNSELNNRDLKNTLNLNRSGLKIINDAIDILKISARSYFRLLKVSRTIADLAGSEEVQACHIEEAISYRISERG
jgi:magnesium chelatase family protein